MAEKALLLDFACWKPAVKAAYGDHVIMGCCDSCKLPAACQAPESQSHDSKNTATDTTMRKTSCKFPHSCCCNFKKLLNKLSLNKDDLYKYCLFVCLLFIYLATDLI